MSKKIYVASSWKNPYYEGIVAILTGAKFQVYDFKDPETAFSWNQIQPPAIYDHPLVKKAHEADKAALDACEILIIVLPSGKSSHWEAGYAKGQGKKVIIYAPETRHEAETVYLYADDIITNITDLLRELRK